MTTIIDPQDCIDKLKGYRKKKKLTQVQFAESLGLSQGYYSKIEAGTKEIPLNLLRFIRKKLN